MPALQPLLQPANSVVLDLNNAKWGLFHELVRQHAAGRLWRWPNAGQLACHLPLWKITTCSPAFAGPQPSKRSVDLGLWGRSHGQSSPGRLACCGISSCGCAGRAGSTHGGVQTGCTSVGCAGALTPSGVLPSVRACQVNFFSANAFYAVKKANLTTWPVSPKVRGRQRLPAEVLWNLHAWEGRGHLRWLRPSRQRFS